jgi:hypothetical protein
MTPHVAGLVPFDQAADRLRVTGRSDVGVREIPIRLIVGSVGRSRDLDRNFEGAHGLSPARLQSLRERFPAGDLPAIDVFQVGQAYFVEDGHHRVALSIKRHAEFIDARVTRIETNYEVGPDVDVCRLVHTEQQRDLLDNSGLADARPGVRIEFTLLDGYTQTSEIIKAYGYDLARARGTLPPSEQVAASWYDTVYRPAVQAARRARLPEMYASWHSTDGDFFLWLYQIRRDLLAMDAKADFDAAAQHARLVRLGWRRKRIHLRDGRRPLPRKPDRRQLPGDEG